MPSNTKMEPHDTSTSKLAEIKAISPMILWMVITNTLPVASVKWSNFWWITYMLGLVDSLFDRQLGRNCAPLLADLFLYSYENEVLDKFIKEGKRKLARKFSLSYCYTDDLLSIMKDLMNSSLISTQKNSPFLRLQNLLQLLLISTSFLLEIRTTTLPPN